MLSKGSKKTCLSHFLGNVYSGASGSTADRRVAAIAEPDLVSKLRTEYLVMELLPSCVEDVLAEDSPDFIVVQLSMLNKGIWLGSIDQKQVSSDILAIQNWNADVPGAAIVLVDDHNVSEQVITSLGTEFFPNSYFFERVEGFPPRSLIYKIVQDYGLVIRLFKHQGSGK